MGNTHNSSPSPALLGVASAIAAAVTLWGALAGPARPTIASAGAGALLAFVTLALTAIGARRAAPKGPQSSWRVSVLGSLARMVVVGAGVAGASAFSWFEPFSFVIVFGGLYFGVGLWLAVSQSRSLALYGGEVNAGGAGTGHPAAEPPGGGR